jgi:hypothetical protein
MEKNSETNFLNTEKNFNLNNKAASGIISSEYLYDWNLITDGIAWLIRFTKNWAIKKTVFRKPLMIGKTK